MSNVSQSKIDEATRGLNLLDIKIELFRKKDFRFIVEGIANNSEIVPIGTRATHQKQLEALQILTGYTFSQFLYGGAAGGAKSWTGVCWVVFNALAYPDSNWFIARNQLKDLLGSVFKTFKKVCREYGINDKEHYNFNAQKNYITFTNGSVINLIEVSYKPSDPMYEDLGSTEYTGGWAEEIGEIHPMAIVVLQTRIGRHLNRELGVHGMLFMTCNPKQNWAKTKIYDRHQSGELYEDNKKPHTIQKVYLNCLVTENPFIDEDYINNLRAQANEDKSVYERLFKGNWDYEDNPYQLADQEMIDSVFDNDHVDGGKHFITADVARFGSDKAVILAWKGWKVIEMLTFDYSKVTEIAHAILYLRSKYKIPKLRCIADVDGVGGGVIDIGGIKGFVNGGKVIKVDRETPNYRNLQVQCLYKLADKINEGGLWIDCDLTSKQKEDIRVELAQIQSTPNLRDGTKLDCKSKGLIKSDIGRSPDYRDALFMRVYFDLKPSRRRFVGSSPRNNM